MRSNSSEFHWFHNVIGETYVYHTANIRLLLIREDMQQFVLKVVRKCIVHMRYGFRETKYSSGCPTDP